MAQEVNMFKMINGQEVVSKISHVQDDCFILEDPREIAPVQIQGPDGRPGFKLQLAPFLFTLGGKEKSVMLSKTAVMARTADLPEALIKEYLSSVSGIVLTQGLAK